MWTSKQVVQSCCRGLLKPGGTRLPSRQPPTAKEHNAPTRPAGPSSFFLRDKPQRKFMYKPKPVAHRPDTICYGATPDPQPCLNTDAISLEMGSHCHEKLIRSFIYTHYWQREPSTVSSYIPINSDYLAFLTEKYARSGDRYIAFEKVPRTRERRIIGILWCDKMCEWIADELDVFCYGPCRLWGEDGRIRLLSKCIRGADIFKKYHVSYIYDMEMIAVAPEACGHGVAQLLMAYAMARAIELRMPGIQMICTNEHLKSVCERLGMKKEYSISYNSIKDHLGNHYFYHRYPHYEASVYARPIADVIDSLPDRCNDPYIWKVYKRLIDTPLTDFEDTNTCFKREPKSEEENKIRPCVCPSYVPPSSLGECPTKCYRSPMTKVPADITHDGVYVPK